MLGSDSVIELNTSAARTANWMNSGRCSCGAGATASSPPQVSLTGSKGALRNGAYHQLH
jgi:hypothetical protein